MELFHRKYGIIPACDVSTLKELEELVEQTHSLDFIVGYKIGMQLVLVYGIKRVLKAIRSHTELPVIYDHQKFGTDIPDICGGPILGILKNAGLAGIIAFPQSGIQTLRSLVEGCKDVGLTCIVGGEMTHKGYLAADGGYICDDGPRRMYSDAAKLGIEYFVIPGTKLESMRSYSIELQKLIGDPRFLFPGIGRGQGGDIAAAFSAVSPLKGYAIVGRGIYGESDKTMAARRLWETATASLKLA